MRLLLSLLAVLLMATTGVADSVILKNGTRIEGSIKRVGDDWHVTAADGTVTVVPVRDVQTIELGPGRSEGNSANAALGSLRRSVEALDNLDQIIERYERFVETAREPAVADEARRDLQQWQERRRQGLVKQGGQWVTPEEARNIRQRAIHTATQVRDLMRQGRLNDAETQLLQAMKEDPANPAALYLRGVLLYRQDKLVDARKSFEAVNQQFPEHAPTLNNLAVIVWRQRAEGPALNYFDQAMQLQPVNKFILDNVAEALGALPDDNRRSQNIQRVARRFTEQDTLLQQQMAPHGWYRWGSQWVDQKQLDELRAAEREVRERLREIENEFEQNKRRISEIDNEIAANERQLRDIEARSIWRDKDGRIRRWPLPQAYYELKARNDHLRTEQQSLQRHFETLRETFRRTQQQLPVPRFTGVMQLVGIEGTPLLPPLAAPTSPAPANPLAPSTSPAAPPLGRS